MAPTNPERIECFFDGSCRGNQFREKGPMRAAYVIGDREVVRDVPDLRTREGLLRSNNVAEYHGLIFLLRELREMDRRRGRKAAYTIYGDSQPQKDIPELLALYKDGKLKLDELVTRTYTLDQVNEAYNDTLQGRTIRGVIEFK